MHRHSDRLVSAPRTIDGNCRRGLLDAPVNAFVALTAGLKSTKQHAGWGDGG